MKNNLEQYEEEFSKNLEEKFKKIFAIEYHYDIDNIISTNSKLTSSELDDTLEKLINKYLLKIEEVATMEKYQAVSDKVDEGLEFFVDYKNHHSYDEVFEEAEEIADDLILKILKQKNRHIKLPISIQNIKEYSIHNTIKKQDINRVIKLIVLVLSINYYCLKEQ